MDNALFALADELIVLRDEKKKVEERLKRINAAIEEVDTKMSAAMVNTETQNFTRAGTMFYLTSKTRASPVAGCKEPLFEALRNQGFGDLVQETVNAGSLSAFVKEQIAEHEDTIPGWLDGLVNVYEQTSVRVRKSAKS